MNGGIEHQPIKRVIIALNIVNENESFEIFNAFFQTFCMAGYSGTENCTYTTVNERKTARFRINTRTIYGRYLYRFTVRGNTAVLRAVPLRGNTVV